MPVYTTPGTYVNDATLTSLTPATPGVTTAVFFGTAARGPVTPTLISDWPTYKNIFGNLDNAYDLGYAVYHFFANGGRGCYVNRVVGAGSATATNAAVPFYPAGLGGASVSLCTATADSPGAWGNAITLVFTAGNATASSTVKPTFNLSILLSGVEVEKWLELSPDINSNRYFVTTLNTYSAFITITNPNAFVNSANSASAGVVYATAAAALAGGTDVAVAGTDYSAAVGNVDLITGTLLLNAVGQNSSAVVNALASKAASRGDSFVIVDPALTDTTFAQLQTTAANLTGVASGNYLAMYTPSLLMVDPAKTGPSAIRNTYPGGAIAGMYVRTDVARTVAKAPAGYSAVINGAIAPNVLLTDTQVGTLYTGTPAVNSFKSIRGAGTVSWGTRTFEKVNADRFINVRRTLNYLHFSLKDLTAFAVFEPNDINLWNSLTNRVGSFLTNFWQQGGLQGKRSGDAFFVVCDSTNNTPATIDQGQVNVQVGVALLYPAEYIIINLSQWTGGSNSVLQF